MSDYSTYLWEYYHQDLEYCKQFLFSFGSNYSLGTRLFPRALREATIFFYAFVRYADELVDNPEKILQGQTHTSIDEFESEWSEVVKHGMRTRNHHPIIRSMYYLLKDYAVPFEYSFDFLKAMKQDLVQERYTTYRELEHYMWGSASVIGHIMSYFAGVKDSVAFEHARALGEAMQLANFLRDIDEDYQKRNRIYFPQQDLQLFGVSEVMIKERNMTPELRNFIRHYADRTEFLFKKGIQGIKYLKQGKFSILLASRMYRENIRILKRRNYNIFERPIRLSNFKKILILVSTSVIYLKRGLH